MKGGVAKGTVTVNGVEIFYHADGSGPPVLLVMGLGAPHVGWDAQVPAFRARYRAVAFDNRGCGLSACPPGRWRIRDLADDAVALLDALHIRRAHVCGVSLGGMVAQEIALGSPERVGALVLASTYAAPSEEIRALARDPAGPSGNVMATLRRLTELTFSAGYVQRESARLLELFVRGNPRGPNLAGIQAQAAATLAHDTRGRIARISAPTLVLTGTADTFIRPALTEEVARLIPGARLARIEGGTHGMNIERAEEWNEIVLGFLAEHDALLG